jgi:hypothetical protein
MKTVRIEIDGETFEAAIRSDRTEQQYIDVGSPERVETTPGRKSRTLVIEIVRGPL